MTLTEQLAAVESALQRAEGMGGWGTMREEVRAALALLPGLRREISDLELKLSAFINEAVTVANESTKTEDDLAGWSKEIRVLAITCGWPGSHSSRHPWSYIVHAVEALAAAEATAKSERERCASIAWAAQQHADDCHGYECRIARIIADRIRGVA